MMFRAAFANEQAKDYMVEKNRKLKEQFAAAAASGSSGVAASLIVASLRPPSLSVLHAGDAGKAAIFRGLSFWMTGRTCLPDQELKRIIVEHGGGSERLQTPMCFATVHVRGEAVRQCAPRLGRNVDMC